MSNRLTVLKTVLWTIVGMWAVITVARFTHGLGATTNLHDAAPWGLWIGFDVMAGVALAAGAFVLAASVYIFHLEKYRSFVRPAILTAFLGYTAVAVGLLYDLGLPWNIWHPMIYWQHQSVLFEVAMCVIIYLTVLALEFAPVVLEHPLFDRALFRAILAFLKKITLLLVIAGIILSTLHQSSLGSLFLIAPHRLHPLWYSPIIYVLFFVSAMGLGLMVVTAESLLAGYFLGHRVRKDLLSGLGRAAAIVLGLYVVLRVGDLAVRGVLGSALDGSWLSVLFLAELGISAVIPMILLAIPRVRRSVGGVATCAAMTVCGMVGYRINVCFVAFARPAEAPYFPAWTELAVSLGIIAAAILVFIFFVENLRVYEHPPEVATGRPSYDPATLHGLMPAAVAVPRRYTLAIIAGAALTVALLPEQAVMGLQPRRTPVSAARTIEGLALDREDGVGTVLRFAEGVGAEAQLTPLLMIDGNRDGRLVLFDHQGHEDRLGGEDSCAECLLRRVPSHEPAPGPGLLLPRVSPRHVRADGDVRSRAARADHGRQRRLRAVPRGGRCRQDPRDGDGLQGLPRRDAHVMPDDRGSGGPLERRGRLHGGHARAVHPVPRTQGPRDARRLPAGHAGVPRVSRRRSPPAPGRPDPESRAAAPTRVIRNTVAPSCPPRISPTGSTRSSSTKCRSASASSTGIFTSSRPTGFSARRTAIGKAGLATPCTRAARASASAAAPRRPLRTAAFATGRNRVPSAARTGSTITSCT
jgi:Ni/Fe-hydrogenase subunit HybB-like protein